MKLAKRRKPSTEIPASSMSDIAFLLIIFFMVTTVFNKEQGLNITLPEATKPKVLDQNVMHIALNKDDYKDGFVYVEGKKYPLDNLTQQLMIKKMRNPNISVVLKSDESVPYFYIKKILDLVRDSLVFKVSLAVKFKQK
ncbi:biopolymer transporter ExbD [bacterium]|nr:biopolymer transporter ExbD [bacterium]